MKIIEYLKLAFDSLKSNRIRSLLTALGVVIGVASVITLVSMGEGAKSYIINQVRGWGMGANSVEIHPGKLDASGFSMPELTITYNDCEAIRQKVKSVIYLIPEAVGRGRLKWGKKEYTPAYTLGVSSDWPMAINQGAAEGRFFSRADENSRKRVCVIGKTASRKLFGEISPVGENIKINNTGFEIYGILQEKGSLLTYDMDDMVLIPTTLSERVLGTNKIWEVFITLENEKMVPQAIAEITDLLTRRHKKDDFHIHTQQGMIDIINNILNALTGILTAIAAISLIVGGIGIMNIMLVAVTERTREIGIRKAVGACKKDIFMQFLFESVLITLSGAIIGILLGTLIAWGIMAYLKLEAVIAYGAAMAACLTALIVGIFFGVYPAMRASRLDPVEALRYEI